MKKIKLFLLAFVAMFVTTLASCNAPCKVTYTNDAGEEVELSVKPTEEKGEVYDAINALANVSTEETVKEIKGCKLKLNAVILVQDESNLFDLKLDTELQMNKEMKMYANLGLDMKYDFKNAFVSNSGEQKIDGDVYSDGEYVYLDLVTKEDGTKDTMKNKMALSDALESVEDLLSGLDMDSFLPSVGGNTPDFSEIAESKEAALALIEQYNITISNTSSKTVTFKIGMPLSEMDIKSEDTLDIYFEIDVTTMMPVSLKIDADAMMDYLKKEQNLTKAKFEFKAEIEYGDFNIKELSESAKKDYTDFSNGIIGGFPGLF